MVIRICPASSPAKLSENTNTRVLAIMAANDTFEMRVPPRRSVSAPPMSAKAICTSTGKATSTPMDTPDMPTDWAYSGISR